MIGTASIKQKQLVICPTCEAYGIKSILGQVGENGEFTILRFHTGETRIFSREFVVQCGKCQTIVYQRGTYGTVNLW